MSDFMFAAAALAVAFITGWFVRRRQENTKKKIEKGKTLERLNEARKHAETQDDQSLADRLTRK